MITARDSLAQTLQHGAGLYPGTRLAQDAAPVMRRVRRARVARATAGSVGAIAAAGVLAVGGYTLYRSWGQEAGPAVTPSPSVVSPSPTASPSDAVVAVVEVPAGPRIDRVAEALASAYGTTSEEALAALVAALPPEAGGNPEGWLPPGVHELRAADLEGAARELVGMQVAELEAAGVPREQWLRVLTVASIIEQETPRPEDMARTARVIENRLEAGMMLQLEMPLRYAVRDDEVPKGDDGFVIDSPYNTYMYEGLPPGAIGAPSAAAIAAAVLPAQGEWLYFVRDPDGGPARYFETFEEFSEAAGA